MVHAQYTHTVEPSSSLASDDSYSSFFDIFTHCKTKPTRQKISIVQIYESKNIHQSFYNDTHFHYRYFAIMGILLIFFTFTDMDADNNSISCFKFHNLNRISHTMLQTRNKPWYFNLINRFIISVSKNSATTATCSCSHIIRLTTLQRRPTTCASTSSENLVWKTVPVYK